MIFETHVMPPIKIISSERCCVAHHRLQAGIKCQELQTVAQGGCGNQGIRKLYSAQAPELDGAILHRAVDGQIAQFVQRGANQHLFPWLDCGKPQQLHARHGAVSTLA